VAEKRGEIGERHLELLRVVADLARNDPAAVAQMYRAAQRMNYNTVGKQADRAEFLTLVRDLEGAGCVEARGGGVEASYGMLSVTEEGHRQLEATSGPPEAPSEATAPEQPGRDEPSDALGSPGSGTARGSWWRRMFGG
jgi:hypothetical protein